MAGTTPTRRRGSKAAQDKAAREAKAAELEAAKLAENGQPDDPEVGDPEEIKAKDEAAEAEGDVPDDEATPPSEIVGMEFTVGEVVMLPKIERSSSKGSVWTDRLNDAAEKLDAAGNPEGGAVPILVCATPRTAANTANNVRRKIREGKIAGMVAGEFEIVTRGRTILATFVPVAPEEGEGEESGEGESGE